MKLYLAGPEVFLPEAVEMGNRKREICARHGHIGLFPLDNEIEAAGGAERPPRLIFLGNVRMIDDADAVVANLSPFRGISADPGTVFEVGYAYATGKPIFGYTSDARPLLERVENRNGPLAPGADGCLYAADGLLVENFGLFDNLMIAEALAFLMTDGGGWGAANGSDLTLFEKCVAAIGRRGETSPRRATGA
jgi:nucleoside 2-deoxyribosyltransferase